MKGEELYKLLKKFNKNCCSEEESRSVNNWYESLDDFYNIKNFPEYIIGDKNKYFNEQKKKLETRIKLSSNTNFVFKNIKSYYKAASVLLISITLFFIIKYLLNSDIYNSNNLKLQEAKVNKWIQLHDGTTIVLKQGSKIFYDSKNYLNHRIVKIQGSAYFDVVHDSKKPFIVYNGNLKIIVLGTACRLPRFSTS